ncbi:MAG: DUF29 domain-containing protein [Pleurocapsa sp.]
MTTKLSETPSIKALYEEDYYLWLQKNAQLIREGKLHELDLVNLLEELDCLGRKEKRSVYINLKILLMHLLKYRYQPKKRSNSWRYSIEEHRQRIKEAFEDSPSLKVYLTENFDKCYLDAAKLAAKETGLALEAFPASSPFTWTETIDTDYLPD